jgi:flagellar motor protein MotB
VNRLKGHKVIWAAASLLALAGCGPTQSINPWALRRENTQLRAAMRSYQDQLAQIRTQRDELDADNEELQMQLAEAEQRAREQSKYAGGSSRSRGGSYRDEYDDEKDFGPARGRSGTASSAGKQASAKKETGGNWAALSNVPGAEVLRDGDAVRIRVTNTSLFDPGKATLKPGAAQTLDRVATALRREYPGHLIGIEGHTDSDPIRKSHWKDNHELSVERAKAVYEYLRTKGGLPTDQLYVAGYGANLPVASNKTSAGKAQNRRVEFVIHPSGARAAAEGAVR